MPRFAVQACALGALALGSLACKKDPDIPGPDGGFDPAVEYSDGGVIVAEDGAIITSDAPPRDPACDEAVTHSDFTWIQAKVFTPSCATERCHDAVDPDVYLDLSAGAAYANLVNKGSSTQTGWTRVVPGSTEQSYLAVALGRAPGPMPRDGFMPLEQPPLCAEKLDAIERWIVAGAPNN